MGKNVDQATYDAAIADRLAGMKKADVEAKHGLSHSQFELAFMRAVTLADRVGTLPFTAEAISAERANGTSWGVISILTDKPESAVRRLYTEGTGFKSQGQRTGKGGRFYYGDPGQPLYRGELKDTGTLIRKDQKQLEGALEAADRQAQLMKLEPAEVAAAFKKATGRAGRGFTKAQMVLTILKAEATPKRAPRARKAAAKKN